MVNQDFFKKALSEYIASLDRADGEKDHQAAITTQVKDQCQIEPGHFKQLAVAIRKDRLEAVYLQAGEMMALVDTFRGGEIAP